ncbi:hypothetical protein BH09MYX1_BH09MYX1_47720 [soil metagenome]
MRKLLPFLFLACTAACAGGLKLTPIKATNNKPSNVVVYFKVQQTNGVPVGGLDADSFKIYEDGELVSKFESKQTILNPAVAASHYTLLLVDLSGSVVDGGALEVLTEAVTAFTDKIEKNQKVAIYAFDGAADLHAIAPFSSAGAKGAAKTLAGFKPQDPSTNLNCAILSGLRELEKALASADQPLRFGTLVVFPDGTDRARRVPEGDVKKALDDTPYGVFAIGLGAEMKESELSRIGRSGTAMAADKAAVVNAFDSIATKIDAATKSFYLLSYCSPARAGKHKVTIEAETKDDKGKPDRSGSMDSNFDATGFQPNCDPNQRPTFDVSQGDKLAPPPAIKTDAKPGGNAGASGGATVKVAPPAVSASATAGEQFNP